MSVKMTSLSITLVSGDLEIAFAGPLAPGAGNRAVIGAQIFQPSISRDVNGSAAFIFGVRLDANGPVGHVHHDARDRNGIWAGIDDPGHVLAVPVHYKRDLIPLSGG